ncbi:hypothetical protein C8Q74DRAFT_1368942 [Fomes fomentarius]|nr:hypothetical protein C8Q74DRAFT_1368942 [Fomes fomentarius]
MSGPQSFFFVDDSDLQSITYDTKDLWSPAELDGAYQATVTKGVAGAKASMQFSGTAIEVVGFITSAPNVGPPAAQFSLDGKVAQTVTAPNDGPTKQFDYFVFEGLSSGSQHTLEIVVLNATDQYPFVLDYLIYLPPKGATPTGSQSMASTSLPSITSTPSPANANAQTSSGVPVGPIVGGVVGGLAVIVAACIAVWFLCFRRRRSNGQPYFYASSAKAGDLLEHEVKPEPYTDARPQSIAAASTLRPASSYHPGPQTAYSAPSQYSSPPSGLGFSAHTPSEAPFSDAGSSHAGTSHGSTLGLAAGSMPRVTSSPNQAQSKAAEAGLLSVPQAATYHADSGVRFDANGQPIGASSSANVLAAPELTDVPPGYSAT